MTVARDVEALIRRAMSAQRRARPQEALRLLQAALARGGEIGDAASLVMTLRALALWHIERGAAGTALACYRSAVDIARGADDELVLAHAVRHLADAHRRRQELEAAEPLYAEAISIYRRHIGVAPLPLADALRGAARLMEASGAAAQAAPLWREAETLYRQSGLREGVEQARSALERCRNP